MLIRHYCCLVGLFSLLTLSARAQPFNFEKEFPYAPMSRWKPGMRFIVPVARKPAGRTMTVRLRDGPVETDRDGTLNLEKSGGKIFTYVGLKPIPKSDRDDMMVVLENGDASYTRKLDYSKEQIEQNNSGSLEGMIYLDEVDKVRKLLLGKTIYPIVQYGDLAATGDGDDMVWLPKYVPVKVVKVEPGEWGTPVMLLFEYPNGKKVSNVYIFSGINSYRGEPADLDRFTKNFSLVNPREKAKGTKDAVWKAIQVGDPVKGMTMAECELAMGKPTQRLEHLDKDQYNEFYYERHHGKSWRIEFKNGVLNKYSTLD